MPYVKIKTAKELDKEFGDDLVVRDREITVKNCEGSIRPDAAGTTRYVSNRRAGHSYWTTMPTSDGRRLFVSFKYPNWAVKREYENVAGFSIFLDGRVKGFFNRDTHWRQLPFENWKRGFTLDARNFEAHQFNDKWVLVCEKDRLESLSGYYVLRVTDKKSKLYSRHCIGPYQKKPKTEEDIIHVDFNKNRWEFSC